MPENSYEVRINGLVPTEEILQDLGEVEMAGHDVTTVLSGEFADQAALSDFLRRLRAHGIEVLEIRRVAGGPGEAPAAEQAEHGDDQAGDDPVPNGAPQDESLR